MHNKIESWRVFPHLFLFGSVCLFILLRIPSLVEPYWYGDEGIYAVIGHAMREGSVLYQDIWDNKPPLLYVLYALVNGELLWIKALSLIVGAATVVMFFNLVRLIIKEKRSVVVATGLFTVLFGTPILEGNIANAENFMLLPICAAFYCALKYKTPISYFGTGVLLSLALMIKSVAVFDIAALLFILFLQHSPHTKQGILAVKTFIFSQKNLILFGGILAAPVLALLYYLYIGAISDLISSTLTTNVGYVGFENHFIFPLGLVFLKIGLLLAAIGGIYYFRQLLTREELLIFPWMAFALFSVFFSDRPYMHYILMGVLPFCLLIGYLALKVRVFPLLLAVSIGAIVITHFSLYQKNIAYYQNYGAYVLGEKNFREYIAFFDRNSVIDYDVAHRMRQLTNGNEAVYYWSDSAQLYMLTGVLPITKYIVAYHNMSYPPALATTTQQVREYAPQYIVSTKDTPIPFKLYDRYELKYMIDSARIYEKSI